MIRAKRFNKNPILSPNKDSSWEAEAVFNASLVSVDNVYHLVYRAVSSPQTYFGNQIELSSIGHAESTNGVHFEKRKLLIGPEYKWEQFGCEDPRITELNDRYYIFYTALSDFPHTPSGIKIGLATTKDFKKISKHQVTHFNSKAMALFPEKINGKFTTVLTVNTDNPPAKIALASFDKEEDIWSKDYWDAWINDLDSHEIVLQRDEKDHVEVGAAPVKTEKGWLLIYSYIKNFFTPPPIFGIEVALLDLDNPQKVIARTKEALLVPREEYELYGKVPRVIFPSGAIIKDSNLRIYYGAADTTCCFAEVNLNKLLSEMLSSRKIDAHAKETEQVKLEKFKGNPIIKPRPDGKWEAKYTFNPAVVYESGKIYIVYRAMDENNTSVLGYASSKDGFKIDERLDKPVYIPREDFEKRPKPGYSGCEDPRITKLGDKLYMCYTAFDEENITRVVLTSIKVKDFLAKKWVWEKPIIISDPKRDDKNACVMSEKINGKYVFFHRVGGCIWIDFVDDLYFGQERWLGGKIIVNPRPDKWDSKKIGIAGPPIKTQKGWLLIYHGLSKHDNKYRLGAILLDLTSPDKILSKLDYPILEPTEAYEHKGLRPGTVFSCGAAVIDGKLFVYYGAADQVIGVATIKLDKLLKALTMQIQSQ